jgi:hypothetical protein
VGSSTSVFDSRNYAHLVARRAEDNAGDGSAIVVIDDDRPAMSRADWLRLLEAHGATDVDAHAAEIVKALRERCEGADADRP